MTHVPPVFYLMLREITGGILIMLFDAEFSAALCLDFNENIRYNKYKVINKIRFNRKGDKYVENVSDFSASGADSV